LQLRHEDEPGDDASDAAGYREGDDRGRQRISPPLGGDPADGKRRGHRDSCEAGVIHISGCPVGLQSLVTIAYPRCP